MRKKPILNEEIYRHYNKIYGTNFSLPSDKKTNNISETMPIMENSKPIIVKNITDEEGLKKAYDNTDSYLHINGNTLYIAGSQTTQDWLIDDPQIPFKGESKRYKDALILLSQHGEISNIVSHSLGVAASAMIKDKFPEKNYTQTGYAGPVASFSKPQDGDKRFRHPFDPVSALDYGGMTSPLTLITNPHSYSGYDIKNTTSKNNLVTYNLRTDS